MYPIFDSHAHYDSERFDGDRDEVLASLPARGVTRVINAASDLPSARQSLDLAERFDFVFAAVGIHPHEADRWTEEAELQLIELAAHHKAVAIGEIGLDYHYDFSPREQQRMVLERQLALAKRLGMPVILHDREAHGDMYDILRKYAPLKGVMHCFSGSTQLAREAIEMGLHVGLGGSVTFKNARQPLEVAAMLPAERLLVETDCPYMAPVPHRGERCESPMIALVAECLAQVRGTTADDILEQAAQNASRLFGVPLD